MGYIQINTEIPGPKSQAILARRAAAVTNGLGKATEVVAERAEGALVYDVDGNTFIDLAGGIGTAAVGHCPPEVIAAMYEQSQKLIHLCAIVGSYEPYVELAELLNSITPGDFAKKTLLSSSGSEAVENAVKFSRSYTGRQAVVSFEGAYHGRTLMALSLTSKYSLFKKGFGPFAPEVYRLPMPYPYRRPDYMSEAEYINFRVDQLENSLITQVDPSAVAAIIVEPVQGEAGFVPVPKPFLAKIREICDKYDIVMIADEIQCGMARTGRLYAIEHYDIVPDLILTAKSVAAGMPLGAVTGRAEILDSVHPGGVGGTYSGNPVICAAGIASINILRQPEFLAHVQRLGVVMQEVLGSWQQKYAIVGDVRGLGAMMLVEFVRNGQNREPLAQETLEIIKLASKMGVIAIRAGIYANCIRFLPPLVITEEQLCEALAVLEKAVAEVNARQH